LFGGAPEGDPILGGCRAMLPTVAASRRKSGPGRVGGPADLGDRPRRGGVGPGASSSSVSRARSRRRQLGAGDTTRAVRIGRRPSNAGFLALVAAMWLAVGVVVVATVSTSWKLIPAVVSFGIGLMFLRGAVTTMARRERRRSLEKFQ